MRKINGNNHFKEVLSAFVTPATNFTLSITTLPTIPLITTITPPISTTPISMSSTPSEPYSSFGTISPTYSEKLLQASVIISKNYFQTPKTFIFFFLFLLISTTCTQGIEDMFFFDPSPMNQDVMEGSDVLLRCDVSNRAKITFYWTYNNKQVQSGGRRVQEDSNLRVRRVDRLLDAGSFRCVASNVSTGQAIRSTEARLNIMWISKEAEIQSKQFRASVRMGEEVVVMRVAPSTELAMKCQVEGNPHPTVQWFLNEARITPSDLVRISINRLRILRTWAKDNGVYRCVAGNQAGERHSVNRVVLVVHEASFNYQQPVLDTATFTPHVVVKPLSDATINCHYFSADRLSWHFQGIAIEHNSHKHRILSNDSLVVHRVTKEDEGAYTCVGVASETVQYTAVLELSYIEEMDNSTFEPFSVEEAVVVKKGGMVDIPCKIPVGLPKPSVRWIKLPYIFHNSNSAHLSNDVVDKNTGDVREDEEDEEDNDGVVDEDVLMTSNGRLTFSNVDVDHTGRYYCVAQNTAGAKNKSIDVVVTVPPVILRYPISIRVVEGESASFDCVIVSTPYPFTNVSWLFDDEPIQEGSKHIEYGQDQAMMTLRRVELKDQGSYACILNTSGQALAISNNAHLYVEKRLKFRPELNDTNLELGKEGQLFCRADGKTRPSVRWSRKRGLPDNSSDRGGVLVFSKVRKEDEGEYTCTALNEQGSINTTITLTVFERPSFKVKPEGNVTGVEGRAMLVHCYAMGDPRPSVSWYKNNQMLPVLGANGRIKVLHNGTLVIREVYMEDFGEYVCVAENIGGSETSTVFIKVYTVEEYSVIAAQESAPKDRDSHMIKTVAISLACGAIYLAFVIGLTVYCTVRITKAKQLKKNSKNGTMVGNGGDMHQAVHESAGLVPRKELENSSSISTSSYNTRTHPDDYNTLVSVRGNIKLNLSSPVLYQTILPHISPDKLYISRYKIQILGLLGQGHYGDVFVGKLASNLYNNSNNNNSGNNTVDNQVIMVKSFLLKSESTAEQCLKEIDMFGRCEHKHVVRLLGLCVEVEPLFVVLENTEWGDLKKFLLASRDGLLPRLSSHQLTALCSQVALGMEHLYHLGLVHKDVAARNIIVNAALMEAKVSMPSLCKDVYAVDYFMLSGRLIPLRWMAPEAILDSNETRESDVYSYGVMVWEVYSLGELPLCSKTNEEILEGLNSNANQLSFPVCPIPNSNGNLFNDYNNYKINTGTFSNRASTTHKTLPIHQLSDCPENMWRLIQSCTVPNSRLRPRFPDIVLSLYDLTYETVKPRMTN